MTRLPPLAMAATATLHLLALFATPARALDFAPCNECGHARFDCATVSVPVDHDGAVPGTIGLHVERLRGRAPDLPVLVALAGGPGQSATAAFDDAFVEEFGDPFKAVQLVVFDQRGTGLSGALECSNRALKRPARCDRRLGPAGALYRTADSVLDLDAVRAALGAEQLIVFGVSYGTFVAAEYARTFPDRVQALVLDSPIGPGGVEALAVTTAHATGRVLEALCEGGACNGITADPVGDTAALVRRLARRRLRGRVRVPGKRPAKVAIQRSDLLGLLVAGDTEPALRELYPAAAAAALEGDAAPLLRLAWLAKEAEGSTVRTAATKGRSDVEEDSDALYLATSCADTRFPWDARARPRLRRRALLAAAEALPEAAPFPFDRDTLVDFDVAGDCPDWLRTTLPGAIALGPLPDVPLLVLVGDADLRTPLENATALTQGLLQAATVVVPHTGHSVVTSAECAEMELERFLTGAPLGHFCDGLKRPPPAQPLPLSLDALPEWPGLAGLAGRTLTAVYRTVINARLVGSVANGDVGGLRRGTITHPEEECRPANQVLVLKRASLIRGVAVSGTVSVTEETWTASVTVGGREAAAGSLEFRDDGSITGRLGDQDVDAATGHGGRAKSSCWPHPFDASASESERTVRPHPASGTGSSRGSPDTRSVREVTRPARISPRLRYTTAATRG